MKTYFDDSLSRHYTMVAKHSQSVQAQLREANLKMQEKLASDSAEIDLLNTEILEAKETLSKLQPKKRRQSTWNYKEFIIS